MNDETKKRRGRIQIILLALVFFGPLMLAIWMYHGNSGSGDAGVNYGELLTPPLTLEPKIHFDSGTRGRWTLAYLPPEVCNDDCSKALIDMRQIRLATGREIDRIERAVIAEVIPALINERLSEHPGLLLINNNSVHGEAINLAFARLERDHIYVLDPLGNLIMKYPSQPDRKGVLRDLKKLLKFSRIG